MISEASFYIRMIAISFSLLASNLAIAQKIEIARNIEIIQLEATSDIPRLEGICEFVLEQPVLNHLGLESAGASLKRQAVFDATKTSLPSSVQLAFTLVRKKGRVVSEKKSSEIMRMCYVEYEQDLHRILGKEKFLRLKQLKWQRMGNGALLEPRFIRELQLSVDQQVEFLEIDEAFNDKCDILKHRFAGREDTLSEKIRLYKLGRDAQLGRQLTNFQRQKFIEMKGEPFDFARKAPAVQ